MRLFLMLFLIGILCVQAQKRSVPAEITFKNGRHQNGWVQFPINLGDKHIKTSASEEGKLTKIASETIESIIFKTADDLVQMTYVPLNKFNLQGEIKPTKWKCWTLFIAGCDDIMILKDAASYHINSHQELVLKFMDAYEYTYLLKRKNETGATPILTETANHQFVIARGVVFRKRAAAYFKDYPELVEKINAKDYEKNLFELMEDYCRLNN